LLLVNRNYSRLWAGQAVSQVGDLVFEVGALLIVLGALYAAAALREVDRPDPATEVVHASPPQP